MRHVVIHGHELNVPILRQFAGAHVRFLYFQREQDEKNMLRAMHDSGARLCSIEQVVKPQLEALKLNAMMQILHYYHHITQAWEKIGIDQQSGKVDKELRYGLIDVVTTTELLWAAHDRLKIDLVVVFDDVPRRFMAYCQAARFLGIPSLHVAHGIYPQFTVKRPLVADYAALFGDFDRSVYERSGVSPERLIVTGNPAWDSLIRKRNTITAKYGPAAKAKFRVRELGMELGERLVVWCSTWTVGQSRRHRYFQRFHSFMRALRSLWNDHGIHVVPIVKLHPQQPDETAAYQEVASHYGFEGLQVEKRGREALFYAADLVICEHMSSALVEAMVFGARTMCVMETWEKDTVYWDMGYPKDAIYFCPPNTPLLATKIRDLVTESPLSRAIDSKRPATLEKYAYKQDGRAAKRVAALMEKLMEEKKIWRNKQKTAA